MPFLVLTAIAVDIRVLATGRDEGAISVLTVAVGKGEVGRGVGRGGVWRTWSMSRSNRGDRWEDGACVEKWQKDKNTIDVADSKSLLRADDS